MSKTYRIAVIGTGAMGKKHVEGWQLAGHHVASVVDLDQRSARDVADQFGVERIFADYREAIAQTDIDIVSICLPLKFHAPVAIFAAEQGKHVFCEKPLTGSSEEARRMVAAFERTGVQFGIGFQRSYAGDTELFSRYAHSGQLGRPLWFNSESFAEVRPKIAMHDYYGNQGPIMDVCCHSFFLWRTVFQSRAKSVYGNGRILAEGRPELQSLERLAIDTASIVVEYESGDVGAMTVSWGLAAKTKLRGKTPDRLIGPLGAIEAAGGGKWNVYIGDQSETVQPDNASLHEKQFAAFAQSLEEGSRYPIGLAEGREILTLTEAVFESIATGQVVPIVCDEAVQKR
ncbi:MAG: hypothetical protein K0Q59_4448 [Paenibacillus sp.]|jgi:predicted dehydrogenase|nr:hypothetical protein [Paenibacillus sp.]